MNSKVMGVGALLVLLAGCLGDVDVPPSAPTLFPVESPTRRARQTIEGTKRAHTAVLNHGAEIIPLDEQETWSYELALQPGENQLDLTCRKESGKESKQHTLATIVFEPDFPAQPTLDLVTTPTNATSQRLSGSKQAQTALVLTELDGQGEVISSNTIVELDAEQEWSYDLQLGGQDQVHFYSLTAVDSRGRASEPVDFEIEVDRSPPVPVSFYPADGEADIPTNVLVYLVLDGPIYQPAETINPAILVVRDSQGTPVPSSLLYNPLSHSIFMAGMFSPNAAYTVSPNPALIVDLAGNTAPPGTDWSWSFTTGQDNDNSTPSVPTLIDPEGVDADSRRTILKGVELTGTKDPLTSIWIGISEIVALSQSSTWSYFYELAVGENQIEIVAKSRTGRPSPSVATLIIRDLVRPAPPTLDPLPPETVSDPLLTLEGGKPAGTSVLYNGRVIVPRNPNSDWVYNADLVPGPNEIELRTRDASGVLSDPLRLTVDFAQEYEGPVGAGFKLMISFALRDLSRISPVQSTFATGANRYSIDAWIEGPLEPGETCVFDSVKKERQNIRYLATLVHYIGSKAGHNNPFWDADYRAPDYLAALVTGGVFDYLGLGPASDRRDDTTGFQSGDLVDATGKVRFTLADLENIDGITEATVTAGPYTIEWVPLDRQLQRIQQGEYLIHVLLGLDRDPSWVANNDLETCWGDESFNSVGQHRIVRRMSLGAVPYSITIGQIGELAAQDPEQGADQLRYLTSQGITFRWVKSD